MIPDDCSCGQRAVIYIGRGNLGRGFYGALEKN